MSQRRDLGERASTENVEDARALGIGYTLATGRLFCDVGEFHAFAEQLLGRPILTHEFGDKRVWDEMRAEFEMQATARLVRSLDERANRKDRDVR